jgi:hypothetical protein
MAESNSLATVKNRRLQQQVQSQKQRVSAQGGSVKKGGPSILSRIFDVISRPLYGVSEGIARASEHAGPANPRKGKSAGTDILKGLVGGLAGKNKTDMGQALLRAAEADPKSLLSRPIRENRYNLRTGAGFVGNIVADPLTYSGVGVVRSVGQGTARAAGLRAAQQAIEAPSNVKKVLEAGTAARAAAMEKQVVKAAAKGKEVTKTTKKANTAAQKAMKAERELIRDEARRTVGEAVTKRLIAENPGKVQLKFAGKVIGSSEKAYKGVANIGRVVGKTEAGKTLNEAFRTSAKFPELTNRLKRQVELHGIETGAQEMKKMRDFFKPLTKEEKAMIPHLIEGRVNVAGLKTAAGEDLGTYVNKARDMFRAMGEDEVAAKIFRKKSGVHPEEFLHDNYVYHWYEGGSKAAQKEYKQTRRKAIGPETPGFTQKRSLPTLKDAKAAGLKPLENVDDILAKRMGKHYQAMSRSHYVNGVTKEYGTQVGKLSRQERAKLAKEGYRPARSELADKGVVFPDHIAKSLEVLDDMHNSDELYTKFIRVFDNLQNTWKFGATSLNLGHHIRNMIGDAWNGFVDGIDNPKFYTQAARLSGKGDLTVKVGRRLVKKPELLELEAKYGAKSGYTPLEIGNEGLLKGVRTKANAVADARETYMRRAHFLGALQQEGKTAKTLEEAAEKAAARVRKWKIDYGDVTDFERNVAKRAIPFYTWTRKNIPLQIEALAMRPGRVGMIPKGQAAIQSLLGTDEGGYNNFGDLDTVPKWLKEMAPVRLRGEGEGKNALYWNAPLPFQDITRYIEGGEQGIWSNIASQATPALRIPFEKATGKQVFSGSPVGGNAQYLSSQNPLLRQIYNAVTGKEKLGGIKNINYLTGAGLQEIKPGQVAGELRRQEDPLQKQLRAMRDKARKKATGN